MDWQTIVAVLAAAAALAYVVRRWYRTWFGAGKHGACAGCDCGHEPSTRSSQRLD